LKKQIIPYPYVWGATSADRDGFKNLIKKYPIIAIVVVMVTAPLKYWNKRE
jgi:hypothetical protein